MKTPKVEATESVEINNLGRAAMVHALKAKGVAKKDALAKVQKKFSCPLSLLERIWKRGERGAKVVEILAKKKGAKVAKVVASKVESDEPSAPKPGEEIPSAS